VAPLHADARGLGHVACQAGAHDGASCREAIRDVNVDQSTAASEPGVAPKKSKKNKEKASAKWALQGGNTGVSKKEKCSEHLLVSDAKELSSRRGVLP